MYTKENRREENDRSPNLYCFMVVHYLNTFLPLKVQFLCYIGQYIMPLIHESPISKIVKSYTILVYNWLQRNYSNKAAKKLSKV